jgi:hypothetical protein
MRERAAGDRVTGMKNPFEWITPRERMSFLSGVAFAAAVLADSEDSARRLYEEAARAVFWPPDLGNGMDFGFREMLQLGGFGRDLGRRDN